MTDLYDLPKEERTREAVEAHYRAQFPLVAAYRDIIAERNYTPGRSINDPSDNPSAVTNITAAEMALARIGRPARDRTDVLYAERYIRAVLSEMEDAYPPKPLTITDAVIDGIYGLAGCMPTAEDWEDFDGETVEFEVDEVMGLLPDHTDELRRLLREALTHAMPSILREISANYHETPARTDPPRAPQYVEEQRVPVEASALTHLAATGASTVAEAVAYIEQHGRRSVLARTDLPAVSTETLRVATNIGLTDARKTLAELRVAAEQKPSRTDLAESVTAWEDAVARLEAFAGPSAPSRKREASDG